MCFEPDAHKVQAPAGLDPHSLFRDSHIAPSILSRPAIHAWTLQMTRPCHSHPCCAQHTAGDCWLKFTEGPANPEVLIACHLNQTRTCAHATFRAADSRGTVACVCPTQLNSDFTQSLPESLRAPGQLPRRRLTSCPNTVLSQPPCLPPGCRSALADGMAAFVPRHPTAPMRVQWTAGVLLPPGTSLGNGTFGPRYHW